MTSRDITMAAAGSSATALYSNDVFSAYTYTGNSATQTITNGIDLAGNGGLVWTKPRSVAAGNSHYLWDTVRAGSSFLSSNTTAAAQNTGGTPIAPNSTGYVMNSEVLINQASQSYVGWTFRKAPKFFDVVTYTGNGVAGRTIPHSLGVAPGMMIIKSTNLNAGWVVYHQSQGNTKYGVLNATDAFAVGSFWANTTPTTTEFSVGNLSAVNTTSNTYVAYLFAHDTATDGIIQCGSLVTDAGGNATVSLGWEPQFLITKKVNGVADWYMFDTARNWSVGSAAATPTLSPNGTYAEYSSAPGAGNPTATGFKFVYEASSTYIYLAIRMPNKPPTTGTQVYNAVSRTGTSANATITGAGFAPDLNIIKATSTASSNTVWDRLRGATQLIQTQVTDAEFSLASGVTSFNMTGVSVGNAGSVNTSPNVYINYYFKRAPGVFDEVCYTGTGTSATNFPHSLGVQPQLIIAKKRSASGDWAVTARQNNGLWVVSTASSGFILNGSSVTANLAAAYDSNYTSTTFKASKIDDGWADINGVGSTYVAYLFATAAGISKVGSYTGNGSSQTINCGFAAGARFIMIKRTDNTGDWYVWDSTRGIVAANDPHLSLNSTAAEVTTDDSVDTDATGFIVNQVAATNVNVTSASYIFLAMA